MNTAKPTNISANTLAMAKSAKDVRSPLGLCPLTQKKLQLLPLRYGLVEHLDPSSELSMPLTLHSQPLGIRLLRDGYLYIIDNTTGYLHEYAIQNGQITKLLWNSNEVASDQRTTSVGEPHLVFTRQHTLYASYSEIQWTAFKCSHVLKDEAERARLMQRIDPASASPAKGGVHLLSKQQVQTWLAEVAETTSQAATSPGEDPATALPEGANAQESQPYGWENPPLFEHTAIETLTSQVLGAYQNDYLFLVLRDDFGVMRDLASAQLKVADRIGHWSADDACQRQYLTGAYIQSLYDTNLAQLNAGSEGDPQVKALQQDTNPEQQAAIHQYLLVRRDRPTPGVFGPKEYWREAARTNPYARAFLTMTDALGEVLWDRHRSTIDALHLQSWEALHGQKIGQRGIDDLINRAEMEAFVRRQQTLLKHWHKQLEQVRKDRLAMITGGYFHRAAWYYDFRLDSQIQHRLQTEFVCVAALCWNPEAAEKLAAYLQANLLTAVPGLETLTLDAQLDVAKQLTDLSSFSISVTSVQESAATVNALANQFNSLMSERLPNYANLNTRFKGLQSMLEQAYSPAQQLKTANTLDLALSDFQQGRHIDPDDFIRNIGPSARLQLLREFSRSGLTLQAASASQIEAFTQTRDRALNVRAHLKDQYTLRTRELRRQFSGHAPLGSENPHTQRIVDLKAALVPLEDNLTRALTVGGIGAGQIGTVVDGLDWQLREEMDRTVRDYRATGTYGKPLKLALQSKGDGIALLLFVLQGQKFVEALGIFDKRTGFSKDYGWTLFESLIGMSASGFAAVQGLSVTIFQAHIEQMESAAGKLNTMSRLGRWAGIAGGGAFGFGALAAAIDSGKHAQQWGKAFAEGDSKGLTATSLQIAGDGILLGTNTWGGLHTASIVRNVMKTPTELRALAWAEASPRLVGIAARANLVGLIGTALQLAGEGAYNYFNLDELQKWLRDSAWGITPGAGTLQDDWSALARVVQKPTCTLIRDEKRTYLKLVLPGIRTREMDTRHVQILAFQQTRAQRVQSSYDSRLPTLRWDELSAAWAAISYVASHDDEALTLHLPISDHLQKSDFALAFNIGYQLEPERNVIHRTCFVLSDLHITTMQGRRLPAIGHFELEVVEALPRGTGAGRFWEFTRNEMAADDV